MKSNNNLPHRFRESEFRRYEDWIQQAIKVFPSALQCFPGGSFPDSVETCSARLRDAMFSVLNNKWKTKLDLVKLNEIYPKLLVGPRMGYIIVGSRECIKEHDLGFKQKETKKPIVTPSNGVLYELAPVNLETQMKCICHLAKLKAFNCPIHLKGQALPEMLKIIIIFDLPHIEKDDEIIIIP